MRRHACRALAFVALALAVAGAPRAGATATTNGGLLAVLRVGPCPADCVRAIWTVTPAGKALRRLTPACVDCADTPAWSPSGRAIAYTNQGGRLRLMNADGTRKRTVRGVADTIYRPAWSPDGHALAVISDRSGRGIRIVHLDSGRVVSFKSADRLDPTGLDWSPDGTKLLVEAYFSSIYVVNVNGTGLRLLVRGGAYPRWSPDGRSILFVSPTLDAISVLALSSGTREVVHRRTAKAADVFAATWSPDGTRIAYADRRGLHILDLRTRRDRPVATVPRICTNETCQGVEWQPAPKR